MDENVETPPAEAPAKKNKTILIVVVALLVLCCCCAVIGGLGWNFGDQIMTALGLY